MSDVQIAAMFRRTALEGTRAAKLAACRHEDANGDWDEATDSELAATLIGWADELTPDEMDRLVSRCEAIGCFVRIVRYEGQYLVDGEFAGRSTDEVREWLRAVHGVELA